MPSTNWIAPSFYDLYKVLSSELINKANENIDQNSVQAYLSNPSLAPGYRDFDPTLDDRATEQVNLSVQQFRGAIQIAGKYPLSITPATVPPETFLHVLYLAAFGLVNSTANLAMVVVSDKGAYSPLQICFGKANDYLAQLRKGRVIALPTDPTGVDYLTAPQPNPSLPNYNACIQPIRIGASSFPVDLTTWGSIFPNLPQFFPTEELGQP